MKISKAWRGLQRVVEVHRLPEAEQPDQVARSYCGHCGMMLNRATHEEGIPPSSGDVSVCWNCAGVNRFDAELLLKPVRDEDLGAIDVDHEQLAEARALIRAAMTRDPRKTRPEA